MKESKLDKIVMDEVSAGVSVAILRFFQKHAIEISPTEKDKFPVESFTRSLLAEETKDPYPFKESFMAAMRQALEQDEALIFLMYDPDNEKPVRGLCRIIGSSLGLGFMLRNIEDVKKLMGDIRG